MMLKSSIKCKMSIPSNIRYTFTKKKKSNIRYTNCVQGVMAFNFRGVVLVHLGFKTHFSGAFILHVVHDQ